MKVLIATGGTGGHIFPALRVAQELRSRAHQVVFAGVLGLAEDQILSAGFDLINIRAKGLTANSWHGYVSIGWLMFRALLRSFGIVRRINPDKVIGFGGYGSFPVIVVASLLNYKTMIHEQNVVPGKVNRLMGKMVKRVALSFHDSRGFFNAGKTIVTGCPCHSVPSPLTQEALRLNFGLDPYKKTLLVLGGSQGSHKMNEVVLEFVRQLEKPSPLQVIHMTGKKDYETYSQCYSKEQLPAVACAFISNINEAYKASDLVIARAGAACVSEIGLLGLPSILIPYPFAGAHQEYNAKVLADLGLGISIRQEQFNPQSLKVALGDLMQRHLSVKEIQRRVQGVLFADADCRLAHALEEL